MVRYEVYLVVGVFSHILLSDPCNSVLDLYKSSCKCITVVSTVCVLVITKSLEVLVLGVTQGILPTVVRNTRQQ